MIIYLTKQISIILLSNDSLIFENFKKSIYLYRMITTRSSLKFFYKNGDSRALDAS